MSTASPFGTWDSPISPDFITKQIIGIEDVVVDSDTYVIYHVERRPSEGGRSVIVQTDNDEDFVSPDWDAKTSVHTYGGSAVVASGGNVIFSNAADSQLYLATKGKTPISITPKADNHAWHYGEMSIHPNHGHLMISIREDCTRREPANVLNTLVCVNTKLRSLKVVAEGCDFYSSASFSPDGCKIAWIQWNHPHMPWQSAELVVADVIIEEDGISFHIENRVVAVGPDINAVPQQPKWISNDRILFVCDTSDWLNPWIYEVHGTTENAARPILPSPIREDFTLPMWYLGESSYASLDEHNVIWSAVRNGVSVLYALHIPTSTLTEIPTEYLEIRRMRSVDSHSVVFIAKTGLKPDFVVKATLSSNGEVTFNVLKNTFSSSEPLLSDHFSIAEPLVLKTENGLPLYANYYPPKNPRYQLPPSELPPCVVGIHGGPTSHATAGFDWIHQLYTSRGWAWLDVNYGGSTGYGRKYTERMDGLWGEIDVHDTIQAVKETRRLGLVSNDMAVVRGLSAGGYNVLRSLVTYPDFYSAAICHYGISDLTALVKTTHKFQMCYVFKLLGGTPEMIPEVYKKRSPLHYADNIKTPLLILQGDADAAVPHSQAEAIVKTIKSKGGDVEYVLFGGEGHGWRKPTTIKMALENELAFVRSFIRRGEA